MLHRQATPGTVGLRRELPGGLLAAVLATAIGVVVLELWKANLRVPFYTGGDATFALAVVKGVLEHGWYLINPSVGAPAGQHLYDYPVFSGDSLYLLIIKAIGVPFGNPAVVENLFFLLCFPLIALCAYAGLRALRISIGSSIVCAVLFSMLPYRFFDGESHIFQGSYFTVPLGCCLVIAVLAGEPLFTRNAHSHGVRAYLTWRSGATVLACVIMGSSDNYYAAFTTALVLLAAALTLIAGRGWRTPAGGAVVAVLILATLALNGLPNLIYTSEHGGDPAVGQRQPKESDMYALSFADLVLPIAGDRIEPLRHLAKEYQRTATAPIGEGHSASLGLVGTLGLLCLVVALLARGLRGDRSRFADPRYAYAALGAGLAFLIGTVGGLGVIFAYVVSPQLRAWNRISVFIAFFALVGVGLMLDALGRRIGSGSPAAALGFRRLPRGGAGRRRARPDQPVAGSPIQDAGRRIPHRRPFCARHRTSAACRRKRVPAAVRPLSREPPRPPDERLRRAGGVPALHPSALELWAAQGPAIPLGGHRRAPAAGANARRGLGGGVQGHLPRHVRLLPPRGGAHPGAVAHAWRQATRELRRAPVFLRHGPLQPAAALSLPAGPDPRRAHR